MRSDLPRPEAAAGEARIRMRCAGVCDTDLQLAKGYMGFRGVPGHEVVGEVLESSDPRWRGKRVVCDINAGCGQCTECVDGDSHHCRARSVLGILNRDGAFAEEFVMPERTLVEIPDALDDTAAVFAEPLAAALHVLDVEAARHATRVAVVGDGKLGLLIAAALAANGKPVQVVGHHQEKLDLAYTFGAPGVLEAEFDPATEPFDVVVEASGSASGLGLALRAVRPRGTVILKTTIAGSAELDLSPVVIHELALVGNRCGSMSRAVALLASGKLDPLPLIAARYPLSRALEAFEHAARRGTLKVLVDGR